MGQKDWGTFWSAKEKLNSLQTYGLSAKLHCVCLKKSGGSHASLKCLILI